MTANIKKNIRKKKKKIKSLNTAISLVKKYEPYVSTKIEIHKKTNVI